MTIQARKDWLKFYSPKYLNRITDPRLRGADCKSAPAAAKMATYPEEQGYIQDNNPVNYSGGQPYILPSPTIIKRFIPFGLSSQGFVGNNFWNIAGNSLNGIGFTVGGLEFSGGRALVRAMDYVNTTSVLKPAEVMFKVPGGSLFLSSKLVGNVAKALKVGGVVTSGVGVVMTGVEIIAGKKRFLGEGGFDLIMGGVAFIPGGGWIVSGVYFGGKALLEYTGNDFWNKP